MRNLVLRGLVFAAVVLAVSAAEQAAEPTEPEPVPEGTAAEEPVAEEPEVVLNCNANGPCCGVATGSATLPSPPPFRTGRAARQGRVMERRLRGAVA